MRNRDCPSPLALERYLVNELPQGHGALLREHLASCPSCADFDNPFTTPVEAIYVFPLPDGAAVDQMTLTAGERAFQAGRALGQAPGFLLQRRGRQLVRSATCVKSSATGKESSGSWG